MILENIELAIDSLRSNKGRAVLTMLGVIIGIMAVIAIVTIGNTVTTEITDELSTLGANNIVVTVTSRIGGSDDVASDSDLISDDQIELFKSKFESKLAAISIDNIDSAAESRDGDKYANVLVLGVSPGYQLINNVEITNGRFITDADVQSYKNVAVVSNKFCDNMFGGDAGAAIGSEIKLYIGDRINTYTVIGVYKLRENTAFGGGAEYADPDIQTNLYIPISTSKMGGQYKNYSKITALGNPDLDTDAFGEEIESYFSDLYKNNTRWETTVSSVKGSLEQIFGVLSMVQMAFSVIAAISLLVGGIGIMNIMLVSVTERTKEIGTRKALGAKNFHIRLQFVIESLLISLGGGVIGILLGILSAAVVGKLLNAPANVTLGSVFLSVGFSMFVGIFFGYYPANKAAKLKTIDALRYE